MSDRQATVDETGGDVLFADIFIEAAKMGAESKGKVLSQRTIDLFYKEVKRYRKNWEKKRNN